MASAAFDDCSRTLEGLPDYIWRFIAKEGAQEAVAKGEDNVGFNDDLYDHVFS
ncbi:MAG: hypothetical protein ABH826_02980 [Patescibacteria group bacterium]